MAGAGGPFPSCYRHGHPPSGCHSGGGRQKGLTMSTNKDLLQRRSNAVPRGVATAMPFFAEKAENAELWDVEGKRYIDFAGGIAVLNTGHRHPKVMAAVDEQMQKFTHTAFQVVAYDSYIELAERLNKLAPGNFAKKTI